MDEREKYSVARGVSIVCVTERDADGRLARLDLMISTCSWTSASFIEDRLMISAHSSFLHSFVLRSWCPVKYSSFHRKNLGDINHWQRQRVTDLPKMKAHHSQCRKLRWPPINVWHRVIRNYPWWKIFHPFASVRLNRSSTRCSTGTTKIDISDVVRHSFVVDINIKNVWPEFERMRRYKIRPSRPWSRRRWWIWVVPSAKEVRSVRSNQRRRRRTSQNNAKEVWRPVRIKGKPCCISQRNSAMKKLCEC